MPDEPESQSAPSPSPAKPPQDTNVVPDAARPSGSPAAIKLSRLLRIIETLQSGRFYNPQQLAELCGVSERTIYRDLETLQDAGLQVVLDESRQGYFLPQRRMFPPSELSIPEALSLLLICQELGGTDNGIPFLAAARTAAWKVSQNLPPHVRDLLGEISEAISIQVDAHHPLTKSQPHYDLILRSLIERHSVRIDYDAASPEGRVATVLDPFRIIFRRRSWYIIGRSSIHREVRVFHLGRILQAELLTETYEIPERFSLARYLGNAWHLMRESHSVDVVIRFAKQVARNVAEVRWHPTQQTEFLSDGRLEFRVTVAGTEEISWWILGYGDRAEVIQPAALRERLKVHAKNMLRLYSTPDASANDQSKSAES